MENGIIKLRDNSYVKIIEVEPINYNLKSNLEKESILNLYKIFLKACNFNIQIIIQSKKEDLTNHLNKLNIIKEKENENLKKIIDLYIYNINKLNSNNKSDSKKFFILIKESQETKKEEICIEQLNEKYFKIKDVLSRCGNKIININSIQEVKKILEDFLYLKNGY